MNKLDEIKEKIHTIDPSISGELLDLVCEYVNIKSYKDYIVQLDNNKEFEQLVIDMVSNKLQLLSKKFV